MKRAAFLAIAIVAVLALSTVSAVGLMSSKVGAASTLGVYGAAVCSWGPDRLDVFAQGGDYNYYHTFFSNNVWWRWPDGTIRWESIGQPAAAVGKTVGISAASWGSGRIDVFTQGYVNGHLYHKWFPQTSWQTAAWEDLGVPSASNPLVSWPAACSWGPGRLDIFAVGKDGNLQQKFYCKDSDGVSRWHWNTNPGALGHAVPGLIPPAGAPTSISGCPGAVGSTTFGYNRIDVVIRHADGELHHLAYTNTGWQLWSHDFTGQVSEDSIRSAIVSQNKNSLDVYYADSNYHLQEAWYDGTSWHGPASPGGTLGVSEQCAVNWQHPAGSGRTDVFAISFSCGKPVCDKPGLFQKYYQAGAWHPDITNWYNLGYIQY